MSRLGGLLGREPVVVAVGAPAPAEALEQRAVAVLRVRWRPPPAAAVEALNAVLGDPRHAQADATAAERLLAARPHLVDVRPAGQALGLEPDVLLHAGPPLEWERAAGPMRGALIGAVLLEGLASSPEEAERALACGAVRLEPCHRRAAVAPMAGVISASMWVLVVEDAAERPPRRACCPLVEGPGEALRHGAYGPQVIGRLRWMGAVLGPVLRRALRRHGPVDLVALAAQALQMGDELHARTRAATLLLLGELAADIAAAGAPPPDLAAVLRFLSGNDHFFLGAAMAAAKVSADAARGVPGSGAVVAMACNGTDFGVQLSGTGDRWFTGPAGPREAASGIGDSAIMETVGLGAFAPAARRMRQITLAEHPVFRVPPSPAGTATGIDVTRVVRTGILPVIGTARPGAAPFEPPPQVFADALRALARQVR